MKKCTKCKEIKDVDAFSKNKRRKEGREFECKPCHAERQRKYRQENPEKIAECTRKYRQENPEKIAERRRKDRQELSNVYLKDLIYGQTGLRSADIPPEFLEIKKAQVLIHRVSLTPKN